MKRFILSIIAVLPLCAMAQSEWTVPEQRTAEQQVQTARKAGKRKSDNKNPKYLKGAAPLVNGMVEWTLELDVPGQDAQQIYDRVYDYMEKLTHSANQLKGSCVTLVNKEEHSIVTNVKEWIIFKQNAISLDRAETNYKLFAYCKDNHLTLTLSRIVFDYSENVPGNAGIYKAEEWIADETALNKKGTRMFPGSVKFRKKMIDRKDQIFNEVSNLWK